MTASKPRSRIPRTAIADAFTSGSGRPYPEMLNTVQAAEILQVPTKTIRQWLAAGRLDTVARKRGRRWFLWRDALVDFILNGANWT